MGSKILLGYWDIRGLAQPIRLLLTQSGFPWEDKLYVTGPPPDFDKSTWLGEKEGLGLDFPNLPYLIDGDVRISQTLAIVRYLARKAGLDANEEKERRRVDLIVEEWKDCNGDSTGLFYSPNFASMKDDYLNRLKVRLERIGKFLGKEKFFAGDRLTYADFLLYEFLDQHKILEPSALKEHPNLEAFCERIESLPKIKAYMESSSFIKFPLNNRMASFGGVKG